MTTRFLAMALCVAAACGPLGTIGDDDAQAPDARHDPAPDGDATARPDTAAAPDAPGADALPPPPPDATTTTPRDASLPPTDTGTVLRDAAVATDASHATWTFIYNNYYGPGTPGHCTNCHATRDVDGGYPGGLYCPADRDGCYRGFMARGILTSGSWFYTSSYSVLRWINPRGSMPPDNLASNATAASDILAWVHAGALNN